jgi:hypothetical protein
MRQILTSLAVTLTFVGATNACINDSELPGHEREFRSSYQRQAAPEPQKYLPSFPAGSGPIALLGGGGGLLALGIGLVALRKPSAKV